MLGQSRSVAVGYYVAIVLLVIGLAIGVALVTRVVGPTRGLAIGEPEVAVCETGEGSPTCFSFSVRNASQRQVSALCVVLPAPQTTARFVSRQSTESLTLAPGESRALRVAVDASVGAPTLPPDLDCEPVSS